MPYNHQEIDKKWQRYWKDHKIFKTPDQPTRKNKFYILPQLPYPSGSGLHVGHAEVYIACDVYARLARMQGKKVLQVIGWDSFGLPAENYAIKTNIHPKISTERAIDNFREQIKQLGISVDWDREVASHNPDYYQWTQWFFLLMYKRGLAYRKKQAVNWCPSCKTVLANEQVVDNICERCETNVEQREMAQWFFRITDYADRLARDLDKVDWPAETIKRQRDWIGRSEGVSIKFKIKNEKFQIEVFTTRPDTLYGVTYLVLAPENDLLRNKELRIENRAEIETYMARTKNKTELERKQGEKEKTGVELKGIKAIHPLTGEELQIWVADYVLTGYGTGAIMAVPAHDVRDWEFARKFNLPIREVVQGGNVNKAAFTNQGTMINSPLIDSLTVDKAIPKMIDHLEKEGIGKRQMQYKLRDWSVSRQRFWGAPVPIVYDPDGNPHPVRDDDLPILLPSDVDFMPTGQSPLTYSKEFQQDVEKKYGKGWRREVDTLDTFLCSSWYYFRYLDPHNKTEFASRGLLKTWMPVDFYLGGAEHVNGHLLYSRFFTKVLFDAGMIDFDEPFLVHRHQGLILGEDSRKMSKRWGNVINPTDIVGQYGADTLRAYEMFMGPIEQTKPWNTNGMRGVRRFLDKVWQLSDKITPDHPDSALEKLTHRTIKLVTEDVQTMNFNTAIAKLMEWTNKAGNCEKIDQTYFENYLKLLTPFAPHLCEELWSKLGRQSSICQERWPEFDNQKLKENTVTMIVQINGKLRASLKVAADSSQNQAEQLALKQANVKKWLGNQKIKKVIFIPDKLINFVI